MSSRMRALLLAAPLVVALGAPGAAGASASACSTSGPAICVDLSHTPDAVSAAAPGSTTYAALTVVVRNAGGNTATHVTFANRLPAGSGLSTFSIDRGSCTPAAGGPSCEVGGVEGGAKGTPSLQLT